MWFVVSEDLKCGGSWDTTRRHSSSEKINQPLQSVNVGTVSRTVIRGITLNSEIVPWSAHGPCLAPWLYHRMVHLTTSVQDGASALVKAHMLQVQAFPQHRLWNSSNVRLIDDGPLSSFQGRSSSTSSFHASLLQVINGVLSLALCPQVVSQALQHFRSSKKKVTRESCFVCQSVCSDQWTYLACNTLARQPAAKGAALDVPWKFSMQPPPTSVVTWNTVSLWRSRCVATDCRDPGFSVPLLSPETHRTRDNWWIKFWSRVHCMLQPSTNICCYLKHTVFVTVNKGLLLTVSQSLCVFCLYLLSPKSKHTVLVTITTKVKTCTVFHSSLCILHPCKYETHGTCTSRWLWIWINNFPRWVI